MYITLTRPEIIFVIIVLLESEILLTSSSGKETSTFPVFAGSVSDTGFVSATADSRLTPKPFSYKDLLLQKRALSKVLCFVSRPHSRCRQLIRIAQAVKHRDNGTRLVKTNESGEGGASPLELCRRAVNFYGVGKVEEAFEQYDAVRKRESRTVSTASHPPFPALSPTVPYSLATTLSFVLMSPNHAP
jgi:hypothetical protein